MWTGNDKGDRLEVARHFRRSPRPGRKVEVRYAAIDRGEAGQAQVAQTRNIGVGGAFVVTDDPLPAGTALLIELTLPTGRTIEVNGDVRWIVEGDEEPVLGMGVRFHGLAEEELQVLNEYFAAVTASFETEDII